MKKNTIILLATLLTCSTALAQSTWVRYRSGDYGISVELPDPDRCRARVVEGVGHVACHYDDMEVHILAAEGHLSTAELRAAAAEAYDDVPQSMWRWTDADIASNGYAWAESWEANHGGHSVVGVIGHSAHRDMSHVAFISGSDAAWRENRANVRRFVDGVRAF